MSDMEHPMESSFKYPAIVDLEDAYLVGEGTIMVH